jgi:hypothetical protein
LLVHRITADSLSPKAIFSIGCSSHAKFEAITTLIERIFEYRISEKILYRALREENFDPHSFSASATGKNDGG